MCFNVEMVSDKGLVRPSNQDSILSIPERGIFAVADGMGGGRDGELASKWVCEELSRMEDVKGALDAANRKVVEYARERGYETMGSTAVVLQTGPENGKCTFFWVGDSRAYHCRDGSSKRITCDHTVAAELGLDVLDKIRMPDGRPRYRQHPLAHVLTRAVGVAPWLKIDSREGSFSKGDRFLLCSDGVHDLVSDTDINFILEETPSPEEVVSVLSQTVKMRGAHDNFSAVCIFCK